MALNWRTAPRSIIKTLQWFKSIESINGEDWNAEGPYKSNYDKKIHPVRRKLLSTMINNDYETDSIDNDFANSVYEMGPDKFMQGQNDWTEEPESSARQRLVTFETFGFSYREHINKKRIVKITPVGTTILNDNFDGDQLTCQLMKMYQVFKSGGGVYIFQEFLKLLHQFKYLNRWEIGLIFMLDSKDDLKNLTNAIEEFRNRYINQDNKREKKVTAKIWVDICNNYFDPSWSNTQKKDLGRSYWSDYSDAFSRSLIYTGLFSDSGRSESTKIRMKDTEKEKVKMLLELECSVPDPTISSSEQMIWFGNANNVKLPWYKPSILSKIVLNKITRLKTIMPDKYRELDQLEINKLISRKLPIYKMKSLQNEVDKYLSLYAINNFIKYDGKSKPARDEIIERYEKINDGSLDEAALWLEVNTWKFFASLANKPEDVKYNGTVNEDLTPRNYAKGVGNTPDMEVYEKDFILLPEVSLMSGTQQWEHEGSSVAEHVYRKKEKNNNKKVIALFLTRKVSFRSEWLFFILNKDSWAGYPIPIVPMTIDQFLRVVNLSYKNNLKINDVTNLINKQSISVSELMDFKKWSNHINEELDEWEKTLTNI